MRMIIIAILAYYVYQAYKSPAPEVANDDMLTDLQKNSDLMSQPQQKYYVKPGLDKRVDNANQPWYNSSTSFYGAQGDSISEGMGDSSTMNYNTKTFWAELSSRYSH